MPLHYPFAGQQVHPSWLVTLLPMPSFNAFRTAALTLAALFLISSSHAQFSEVWVNQYNGEGDFTDQFNCIISSSDGGFIAGGSTIEPGTNSNFLIVKMDATGQLIWRKSFNAPGNGPDAVKAMAIDGNGILVVTGYGNNINVGNDFWTMRMEEMSGDTLWTRLYNDPVYNQYDQSNSITLDNLGNIIVCGESDRDVSGLTNDDYLTVKYDATGALLWTQRYNGTGNGTDRAVKVVTNSSQEIYVTGRSDNGADDDYVTRKYSPTGSVLWTQVYDNGGTDRATDMGIDGNGNIYITGRSNNGNDDDFRTLKYSPAGALLLQPFFDFVEDDRAEAIDVAADGSFVVTGRSDGNATPLLNWNYYTVRYSTTGSVLWSTTYNGSASNDDWPTDVALDPGGQVLVTGFSDTDPNAAISNDMVTILYSSVGAALWTNAYGTPGNEDSGAAVAVNGPAYAAAGKTTGASGLLNAVARIHTVGGLVSTLSDNGIGDQTENIRDMVVDASGQVYYCGYSVGDQTDRDMLAVKLDANGQTLWTQRLSGTMFGSDEEANSLAIENSGALTISGYTKNTGTGSDITLIRYSSAGVQQWIYQYNGTANESDRALDMELDATGNAYFTGRTDVDPLFTSNDECITGRVNADGTLAWTAVFAGTGAGSDRGKFIRVAPSGAVYVVGRFNNGTDNDILVLKYSNTGQLIWSATNDSGNSHDEALDVYLTASEDLYICGYKQATSNPLGSDYLIMRYSPDGVLQWEVSADGDAGGPDEAVALTTDGLGRLIVTGNMDTATGDAVSLDAVTLCLQTDGSILWQQTYDGGAGLDDIADDVVADGSGYTVVCAHTNAGDATNINYDIRNYLIDPDGLLIQQVTYAESDSSDVGNVLVLRNNNVYLGGSTWSSSEQRNTLTIRYSYAVGVQELDSGSAPDLYPNPCNDAFQIRIPAALVAAEIRVSDATGRVVKVMPGPFTGTIQCDVSDLAPGSYFLHAVAGSALRPLAFIKH